MLYQFPCWQLARYGSLHCDVLHRQRLQIECILLCDAQDDLHYYFNSTFPAQSFARKIKLKTIKIGTKCRSTTLRTTIIVDGSRSSADLLVLSANHQQHTIAIDCSPRKAALGQRIEGRFRDENATLPMFPAFYFGFWIPRDKVSPTNYCSPSN